MNDLSRCDLGQSPDFRSAASAKAANGRGEKLGHGNTEALLTAALLILIAVLWLATRPYPGVVGDAPMYMVAALRELHPARFAGDLYFRFGSQTHFTLYSRLCAPLIAILGVGRTEIALTVAGQLLWVGGLLYLARVLIRDRWHALLAVAAVIALSGNYVALSYGESVATPRLFAEALTILALGLLVRRRTGWALAALTVAAAIHPIMALPGLAIVLIDLALGRPLWWVAIVGAAVTVAGLALAGVDPFANLLVTMDPQWLDVVKVREWFCFITRWPVFAYFRALEVIALSVLALVLAEPRQRRLLGAALIVGIGGLLGTLIGADLLHNVFVIEIQQYRALWPLALLASLFVVPVFARLLRQRDTIALTSFGYLIVIATLFVARSILAFAHPVPDEYFNGMRPLALVGAAFALIYMAIVRVRQTERKTRWLARLSPCLAAALLLLALLGWDQRTPWTRFIETSVPVPESLAALLPRNASVYWEGGVRMLWLRLQRPSYFSCTQGNGAIFFRGTAIAYQHRQESFWPLRTLDFGGLVACPSLDNSDKPERTRADLAEVCLREPGLDDLVLTRPVADFVAKTWDSPVPYLYARIVSGKLVVHETNRFFVYSCASLR